MPHTRASGLILLCGALLLLALAAGCSATGAGVAQLDLPTSTPLTSAPATRTSAVTASSPTPLETETPTRTQTPSAQPPSAKPPLGTGTATQSPGVEPPLGTATATETATGTATRTATPLPTNTPSAQPPTGTPTRTPSLRRLTEGSCCTQPFWSPDARQVLFIDQPAAGAPLGIWGVAVDQPDAQPALYTERIASYTSDMAFVVERDPVDTSVTVVERLADGARWTAPAGGRSVSLSPSRTRIAWQVSDEDIPVESRTTELWVANLDGSDARDVASLPRGSLSGWVDEETLLISSRESLEAREQIISALRLADGTRIELARGEHLRGGSVSPDGAWYLYMVTFDPQPDVNGLWIVRTDGTERRQIDDALFGSYRWRDAGRLLIVPLKPTATFHELWELDVETGAARQLTDPEALPFKIANGDWAVSPDGRHVVFVESQDHNLWLLTLSD